MAFKFKMLLLFNVVGYLFLVIDFRRCKVVTSAKCYSVDKRLLSFVSVCCRFLYLISITYMFLLFYLNFKKMFTFMKKNLKI